MDIYGMLQLGCITQQQYQHTFASIIRIPFYSLVFFMTWITSISNHHVSSVKKNASRLTHHVDTHSPRCPKVLWPRRFLWHVSPAARKPAPRRHAIHAFDLNIEDHLGTTEVATGNQCHSSSGVGRFCVCVFFRNDLNLKPRDPRPKLKLGKTWKKHGKNATCFMIFCREACYCFVLVGL